ncbi:hypothetical protein H9Y04_05440 [Streptomyces sp. TRM66268-LWL]|uniref:Lipoprotein n=1 Tax=Streptomyces polyasparticus TaxID=2767826 RepID=A0ABR7SCF7_9ACTN|nr:hypothetical protein [Streptomyces polyasparticus]MBC9712013.1 hypothetical protein [Streptomyces polyasparticus]
MKKIRVVGKRLGARLGALVALLGVLALTGCSGASEPQEESRPGTPAGGDTEQSTASKGDAGAGAVRTVEGGCGATKIRKGAPPHWNPEPAGFSDSAEDLPYVVGAGDQIMGFLWEHPMTAKSAALKDGGDANKVLWFVRSERMGKPLTIRAHPRGAEQPVVEFSFPSNSGPGEIYPSDIAVPRPGCWTFELSWAGHRDEVDLKFLEDKGAS